MENTELQLKAVIGIQSQYKDCLLLHPSEGYLVYAVGSQIAVKDLQENSTFFLTGHEGKVCVLTCSQSGKLLGSGDEQLDQGFQAALIVWDFYSREMLYRVRFHKARIQGLSFSCNDQYLVSLGGKIDGNQLIVWSMEEGKSECLQPATDQPKEFCQDIKYFSKDPFRFITVHIDAVKFWTFDPIKHKLLVRHCQLGHIKRFINCIQIDQSDSFAYCGTRSGDILELFIDKVNFKRAGPINRMFTGGIQTIISTFGKVLYVGSGDGTVARINKRTMQIEDEVKLQGGVSGLTSLSNAIFASTTKGCVYKLWDNSALSHNEYVQSAHSAQVRDLAFPKGFSEVFASCAEGEIRVWKTQNQKELLRIELSSQDRGNFQCFCLDFMSDGKSIVSGWSDGKIRAFLPQSGKLMYIIADAHCSQGVTALASSADCSKIVSGGQDGQVRLWHIGKQTRKLLMNQKQHQKKVTAVQMIMNDQQVVSASLDGTIILWDLTSSIPLQKIKQLTTNGASKRNTSPQGFTGLAYNYLSHCLVTIGQDRRIAFWNMNEHQVFKIIEASFDGELNQISLSDDGQMIAVADEIGEVKVFGFQDGRLLYINQGHSCPVTAIRFAPDNKQLISGDASGGTFIWSVKQ